MRRGLTLGLVGLMAAGTFVLYRYDPATVVLFPPCPFHTLTGWHCPGCGSLRAFHALLQGDWLGALAFNPLTTLAVPLLLVGMARELYRLSRGVDPVRARAPAWTIRALAVLLVVFGVLRNLPAFGWLAPG